MTFLSVLAGHLVSFSFVGPLFLVSVNRNAKQAVYFLSSCSLYTIAQLVAAIFWFVLIPLREYHFLFVPIAILTQEVARIVAFLMVFFVEQKYLQKRKIPEIELREGVTVGCGFGFTSVLVMFIPLLWQDRGEGTYYLPNCEKLPFFALGSIFALLFSIVQVCITVIAFQTLKELPLDKKLLNDVLYTGTEKLNAFSLFYLLCPFFHILASVATLINEFDTPGICYGSFIALFIVAFLTIMATTFFILIELSRQHGRKRKLKRSKKRGRPYEEMEGEDDESESSSDESDGSNDIDGMESSGTDSSEDE